MAQQAQENSDDDFVNDDGDNYAQVLQQALLAVSNIDTLRNYQRQPVRKKSKTKKKPGPRPSVVRLKFYLLPDGSELPKLTKEDPAIELHQSHGYGFPAVYYSNYKGKTHPVSLDLSAEQFKDTVRSLYPKLQNKDFNLYTVNNRRQLTQTPIEPSYFKNNNYNGTVVIKIKDAQTDTDQFSSSSNSGPYPVESNELPSLVRPRTRQPSATATLGRNIASPSIETTQLATSSPTRTSTNVVVVPVSIHADSAHIASNDVPVRTTSSSMSEGIPLNTAGDIEPSPSSNITLLPSSMPIPNSNDIDLSTVSTPTTTSTPTPSSTHVNILDNTVTMPSTTSSTPEEMRFLPSGTPTVTFHPRHALRLEQDLEFTASLVVDQQKAFERRQEMIRRNLERLERRRKREIQKEENKAKKKEVLEEIEANIANEKSEDCVLLIFQQPDGSEIRKSFPINESLLKLHMYAEALSEVVLARIYLHNRQILERDTSTLKDIGITTNTRLIVEELIEENDSESESETSIQEDELEESNQDEINDLEELEQRRLSVYDNLLPAKKMVVSRDTIVDDVMTHYKRDEGLIHHKIEVTFKGEENAVDLEGLTREMFVVFFNIVFCNFFFGRNEKIPSFDTRILFNGTFKMIGKIMSHCFVLTNYLPYKLSRAIYSIIFNRDCDDDTFLQSFLNAVTEEEEKLIKYAMICGHISEDIKCKLFDLVSDYGGSQPILFPHDLKPVLLTLAKSTLYAKPLLAITNLKQGVWCYAMLWNNVSLTLLQKFLEKSKPSVDKVLSIIECQFTDDPSNRTREERIFTYMEQFIKSLDDKELVNLLKFWTSTDILVPKLEITFNSLDGLQRRPIANTCSASLQLSRFYLNCKELKDDFKAVLSHFSSRMFDSV